MRTAFARWHIPVKLVLVIIILSVLVPLLEQILISRASAFSTSQGPLTATASGNCTDDGTSSGTGTVTWTNPGNAFSDNVTYATASVDGTTTHYIKCVGFGFSIPTGVTIGGIVLSLKRKASGTGNGGVTDAQVRLYKAGTIGATNRATATAYTTTDVTENHGGTADLWGTTWTPSDINNANFGTGVAVTKASSAGAAITASVDVAKLTVYYSFNPVFTQSGYRWFNDQSASRVPSIARSWGSGGTEQLYATTKTSDGGYVVTGTTTGYGAGGNDMLIAKYTGAGVLLWTRTWGGTGNEYGYGIIELFDGSLVVTGNANLVGGNLDDAYIARYSASGTLMWSTVWGGTSYDFAYGITQLTGGNIAIVGNTQSYGTATDTFVAQFNMSGVLQSSTLWGSTGADYGDNIIATSDGGYAISGHTNSYGTAMDAFIAKFSSSSVLSWSRIWGGTAADYSYALGQASDGGYLLTGQTNSFGTAGDAYVVKYDSSGAYQWNKAWGGTGADSVQAVTATSDGGFIIAGGTQIAGAGSDDFYLSKYDNTNTLSWTRSWGGTGSDIARSIVQQVDGIYVLAGQTASYGAGGDDAAFVQTDSTGAINGCSSPNCQSISGTATNPTATTSSPTVPSSSVSAGSSGQTPTSSPVYKAAATAAGSDISIDVGSPLNSVASNTPTTAPSSTTPFRLRMTLHVGTDPALAGEYFGFRLQYGEKVSTCSSASYANVSTTSSIAYANPSPGVDGLAVAANANDPAHGSDQLVPQQYNEANDTSVSSDILAGQDGVWDFALKNNQAPGGVTYCFRLVDGSGAALSSYTYYPELQITASVYAQANYRWFDNANSSTPGAPLVAQDTAATGVDTSTVVRLRQRVAVDTSALGLARQTFKQQYAEKVGTCDVAFSGETYADIVNGFSALNVAHLPASGSSDGDIGGDIPWTNPGNITANDSQYATVSGNAGGISITSYPLVGSNFGFSIPSTATIRGVVVTAGVNATPASTSLTEYASIRVGGLDYYPATSSAPTYGSSTDLWGASITPADLNSANFQARVRTTSSNSSSAYTLSVDNIEVTVYYEIPVEIGPVQYYNNPGVANNVAAPSTANDPTNGARGTVMQTYRESETFTTTATVPAGSDGLWDFVLKGSSTAAGKTYCVRTVKNDGNLLDTYTYIPEISFASSGAPTLDQKTRGGQSVLNGVKMPYSF
jgi:hypothetical protein